jgi:hypothetical protein
MINAMTPPMNPSKDELRAMTLEQIDDYIRWLRQELTYRKSGPVHKTRSKQLEVAVKVRDLNFPDAASRRQSGGAPNF